MQSSPLLALFAALAACARGQRASSFGAPGAECKCVPGDGCWPPDSAWEALDARVGGQLVKAAPVAQSCYDGPAKDLDECAVVAEMWSDQDFQTSNPVGRPVPYNITCAPVDYAAGQAPASCSLGPLPVYVVNATCRRHVLETLAFARKHHIRLLVVSTGHDILGRSDGYGSLEIWLRHYRNGIDFQETYGPANDCSRSGWGGSAIRIDGAYQWRDVYEVAKENNVIVVGGGAVSPGAIGGWPSGGGHGAASRNYGLGADQVLEAEAGFAPAREALARFRDRLSFNESFATYDYWAFYDAESGLYDPAGDTGIMTSRMIDRSAVAEYGRVREAVEVFSGKPEELASNVVLLVSGGKVFDDAEDATSGLHPAWRKSPYALITRRGVSRTASNAERKAVQDDITFVKGAAAKRLAPTTGGYMNEGDRHDPDYIETFYGPNYASHLAAKKKYDPSDVFYCPTCVGSEAFVERPDGPLCRV